MSSHLQVIIRLAKINEQQNILTIPFCRLGNIVSKTTNFTSGSFYRIKIKKGFVTIR